MVLRGFPIINLCAPPTRSYIHEMRPQPSRACHRCTAMPPPTSSQSLCFEFPFTANSFTTRLPNSRVVSPSMIPPADANGGFWTTGRLEEPHPTLAGPQQREQNSFPSSQHFLACPGPAPCVPQLSAAAFPCLALPFPHHVCVPTPTSPPALVLHLPNL
jgi:hypothetical protein